MNRLKRFIKHRNVVVEESIYCNKIWQVFGHVDSFFSNHSTRDAMSQMRFPGLYGIRLQQITAWWCYV